MVRSARAACLVMVALLVSQAGLALADSFLPKDFDQLVTEAEEIFVGTLAAASSSRLPTGAIVTDLTFSGVRAIKGGSTSDVRTVRILGGTIDGVSMKVAGIPDFEVGRTYLLFSKENGRAIFPFVGGPQGVFQIVQDSTTRTESVFDARGNPMIGPVGGSATPDRQAVAPGGQSGPPVSLDVFIQAIRDRLPQ